MSDLIESNEFGDWLMDEISQTQAKLTYANPERTLAYRLRLEALKTSKEALLEYLTLQQIMLETASAIRDEQRGAACPSGL